jgi:hypothetical protein
VMEFKLTRKAPGWRGRVCSGCWCVHG